MWRCVSLARASAASARGARGECVDTVRAVSDALIERVAAAVALGYRDLQLDDAAGLLLVSDYSSDLAPFALELTEVHEDVDRDGYQEELGAPEIDSDPELRALCEPLNARIDEDEDGYVLLDRYRLVLARQIRALIGIPVLVHGSEMPIAEQLRRQTGAQRTSDPLAGMDVLVRVAVDAHQVAAVTLRDGVWLYALARGDDPEAAIEIGPGLTEIGRDPQVVAGALPRGAARVIVQDRKGTWHGATVDRGAWLCVLPQRAGQKDPPFQYLDVDGERFEPGQDAWVVGKPPSVREHESAVRAGALVPALWLVEGYGGPIFKGWEGPRERATGLRYVGGEWDVLVSIAPTTAAAAFEQRLIERSGYGFEGARKRLRKTAITTLSGTLDANTVTFDLAAPLESWKRDQGWVAVLQTEAFCVTVQCGGGPPARIDLKSL
jgi:hypothetical protein